MAALSSSWGILAMEEEIPASIMLRKWTRGPLEDSTGSLPSLIYPRCRLLEVPAFTSRHDMLSYPHLCSGVVEPSKLLVVTVRQEMHSFSVLFGTALKFISPGPLQRNLNVMCCPDFPFQ